MTGVVLCYATFKNKTEAAKLCKALVNEGLIACANLLSPIQSIYRWEGKTEHVSEIAALLKVAKRKVPALKKRFKQLHSYRTPCLLIMDVKDGLPDYLKWVVKG